MTPALRLSADEAVAGWRELISAHHEQFERLAEDTSIGGEDFFAGRSAAFRPGASPSEELEYLESLTRPDDVWMDIGAGAGRLAIPLAFHVRRVITVDTSPVMRQTLEDGIAQAGLENFELHHRRWPETEAMVPMADVTLCANLLYGAQQPIPFVEAMERHSRRLCVITLADRAPRTPNPEVWQDVTGEPYLFGPGGNDLVALLLATGRRIDVRSFAAPEPRTLTPEDAVEQQRWRCGIRPDSPQMEALRAAIERRMGADGLVRLPTGRRYTTVVSWEPLRAAGTGEA